MSLFMPELGQVAFGNEYHQYEPPEVAEALLYALATILLNSTNPNASPCYGTEYSNDIFEMHPYYWGDCTCGFDEEESEWCNTHSHTENCFHTKYHKFKEKLEGQNINPYGKTRKQWEQLALEFARKNGYSRLEGIEIYCDCGYDAEYQRWRAEHDHKPDCPIVVPNFWYKPTNFKLTWYKYIGRSISANQLVSNAEFRKIILHCLDSAKADIQARNAKKANM